MRILIVDDHSLVRDGIVSLLEAAGHEIVGQANDGYTAIDAALRLRPELVLMDLTMPRMGGLEALKQIKATNPEIDIVILTVSDNEADMLEAIRFGARGYIHKSLGADEFLSNLDGLERGEYALSKQLTASLIDGLVAFPSPDSDQAESLTKREFDVLELIAEGLTNKAISQKLSLSENTIKYYVKQIFRKLGVQNRTEAITVAMRSGLLRSQDHSPDLPASIHTR